MSIVTFDPAFRIDFARLNYAWITELFAVEPVDEQVLENPETEILGHGGQVFFAIEDGCVAGTVALKRIDSDRFELTKMAVDATRRGKGYGKLLLDAALVYARERGAKRIELSSHTSLTPAIAMYRNAGFVERTGDAASCYARCNIYMQKEL
jgi:putative acetyltransferase